MRALDQKLWSFLCEFLMNLRSVFCDHYYEDKKLLGFCWKSRMLLNTVIKHDTNENKVFASSRSKVMVISLWIFDENNDFWWFQFVYFLWTKHSNHKSHVNNERWAPYGRLCVRCLHIWITTRFQIVNIWTATSEYQKVRQSLL